MKRLASIFFFSCIFIITTFLLFSDVERWIAVNLSSENSLFTYSVLSFCILASDIILPIPSSLVMILNGKMLGLFSGTLLSIASGLLSSSLGFYLGRKANPLLNKLFTKRDKEFSNNLFEKFGNSAITISKALPVISEALSLVAGTTSVSFRTFLLYSFAGHSIVSFTYAYVGSFSGSESSNLVAAILIGAVVFVSWLTQVLLRKNWYLARYFQKRNIES